MKLLVGSYTAFKKKKENLPQVSIAETPGTKNLCRGTLVEAYISP